MRRITRCQQAVSRPLPTPVRLILILWVAGLAACGGADEPTQVRSAPVAEGNSAEADDADGSEQLALLEEVAERQAEVLAQAEPAYQDARSGVALDWVLSLPGEGGSGTLTLSPQRGRGYAEPLLRLAPREGRASALRDLPRPDCRSETRCEFSGAGRLSVTLPADGPLRAVARGDAVALVARVMKVDKPTEVTLRLYADGRPDQVRQVVLMP